MDQSTITTVVGTLISAAAAVGSGVLLARRKLSKDTVELAKDRAELDILTHLTSQRDDAVKSRQALQAEALQADIDRKTALARSAQLEQELTQLRQKVALLKQLVSRLSAALDLTKNQLNKILLDQSSRATSLPPGIHG